MRRYNLIFYSRNQKSLFKATLFLLANTKDLTLKKYLAKKAKKTFITLLKSPHVNKTAQEQFETNMFSICIVTYTNKSSQLLYILKKIKESSFADLKFKIKFYFDKEKEKSLKYLIFDPKRFKTKSSKKQISQLNSLKEIQLTNSHKFDNSNVQKMLFSFDIYGSQVNK